MLSSVQGINSLISQYYPILHAYYASPGTGKTLLMLQEAHYASAIAKKPSIYLDTEGGAEIMYMKWRDRFNNRFGPGEVRVFTLTDLHSLLKALGYEVEISKKSRVVNFEKVERVSMIFDALGFDPAMVILDSMSKVLKATFTGDRRNFGPRAQAINYICSSLADVAYTREIPVIVTHHASRDPVGGKKPSMYGGDAVKYEFKVVLYLQKKPGHENIIDVYLTRYFDKESWKHKTTIMVTEAGVVDVTQEELRKILFSKGR